MQAPPASLWVRLFCPRRKDRRSDELASGLCVCIWWVRKVVRVRYLPCWPLRWQHVLMEVLECMRCQRITFLFLWSQFISRSPSFLPKFSHPAILLFLRTSPKSPRIFVHLVRAHFRRYSCTSSLAEAMLDPSSSENLGPRRPAVGVTLSRARATPLLDRTVQAVAGRAPSGPPRSRLGRRSESRSTAGWLTLSLATFHISRDKEQHYPS